MASNMLYKMHNVFRVPLIAATSVFVSIFVVQGVPTSITTTTFMKKQACQLQKRLQLGLAKRMTGNYSSLLHCAKDCPENFFGVSVDHDFNCYHHSAWPEDFPCGTGDIFFDFYGKDRCEHKGQWDSVSKKCKCVDGWVGDRCERYPNSCKEMSDYGYDDVYHSPTILKLNNFPEPFLVYCSYYKTSNNFFTYIFTNNGEYDNTLTWKDYVNGFYHDEDSYWIGLDKIKALNDAGLTLVLLRALDLSYVDNEPESFTYSNFKIGPASSNYTITSFYADRASATANMGDCLTPAKNISFSTADNDQDKDNGNCANVGRAGWWFGTCYNSCNPLGPKNHWRIPDLDLDNGAWVTYMYFN